MLRILLSLPIVFVAVAALPASAMAGELAAVERMLGRAAGWLFIAAIAPLAGFGIYVGRVMRFNSWDVLFKPRQVYHGIGSWVADPLANPTSLAFPVLFGAFLFITYLMLYALTHLRPAPATALRQQVPQSASA